VRRLVFPLLAALSATWPGWSTAQDLAPDTLPPPPSLPIWERSLLPPLPDDPTVDADAWAMNDEHDDNSWQAWQLPDPENTATTKPLYLPPPALSFLPGKALRVPRTEITRFEFHGNTLFSDEELAQLLEPFRGRLLDQEQLDEIPLLLKRHYLQHAYFNSAAQLSEPVKKGPVTIALQEGHLREVVLSGEKKLSPDYITRRLLGARHAPLHFPSLQRRLQILQRNPNIARLNAELKPGTSPGEAFLEVEMEENEKQFSYGLDFHNQRSPSLGAEQLDLWYQSTNLTGMSDSLYFRYGVITGGFKETDFSGLGNLSLSYSRPLHWNDTQLELSFDHQDYTILEEPFDELGIEGISSRYSLGISRPVFRSLNNAVTLRVSLDHRRSQIDLLGPFSIPPGFVNGRSNQTSIKLGGDWTRREQNQVLAFRSTFIAGLEGLGSTKTDDARNASFFAWNLSGQLLRKLKKENHLLLVRGGLQLATDPLPTSDQLSLGGYYTVRGYRQNALVRDLGFYLGTEYRFPIFRNDVWQLTLVPFLDLAYGRNFSTPDDEFIASAGLGFHVNHENGFRAELFWGQPFNEITNRNDDLQDAGIHFKISLANF